MLLYILFIFSTSCAGTGTSGFGLLQSKLSLGICQLLNHLLEQFLFCRVSFSIETYIYAAQHRFSRPVCRLSLLGQRAAFSRTDRGSYRITQALTFRQLLFAWNLGDLIGDIDGRYETPGCRCIRGRNVDWCSLWMLLLLLLSNSVVHNR